MWQWPLLPVLLLHEKALAALNSGSRGWLGSSLVMLTDSLPPVALGRQGWQGPVWWGGVGLGEVGWGETEWGVVG